MAKRDIIGGSAGALGPLKEIVAGLPADLAATIAVVLHLSSQVSSSLAEILSRLGPLDAHWAKNGETLRNGVIYVAPTNHHLLLKGGQAKVLFGPRECRSRPSIDVLFRSAAVAFGNRVVGVVLSGMLDDGARGLEAIKRCGGVAVVMDPAEADEPAMPLNALRAVDADHVVPPAEIASLIAPPC